MGRPTSTAGSAWTRFVARWIGALLLVVVSAQSSVAWAFPCLGHDCCDESEPGETHADDSHAADADDSHAADADDSHPADSDPADSDSDDGDEEGGCSCPLPCRPCCAGNVPPVVLPTLPAIDLPGVATFRVLVPLPDTPPPLGTSTEILHVPKALRA